MMRSYSSHGDDAGDTSDHEEGEQETAHHHQQQQHQQQPQQQQQQQNYHLLPLNNNDQHYQNHHHHHDGVPTADYNYHYHNNHHYNYESPGDVVEASYYYSDDNHDYSTTDDDNNMFLGNAAGGLSRRRGGTRLRKRRYNGEAVVPMQRSDDDEYEHHHRGGRRPTTANRFQRQQQQHKHRFLPRGVSCGKKMQLLLLAISITYLYFVFNIYRQLSNSNSSAGDYNDYFVPSFHSFYSYENFQQEEFQPNHHWMLQTEYLSEKRRLARSFYEELKKKKIRETNKLIKNRAMERQQRCRRNDGASGGRGRDSKKPNSNNTNNNKNHTKWYSIVSSSSFLDDTASSSNNTNQQQSQQPEQQQSQLLLATMEDLCGYFAQNASLANPHAYLRQDALGGGGAITTTTSSENNPTRKILLAGHVVSSSLAVHLALTLREECLVGQRQLLSLDDSIVATSAAQSTLQDIIEPFHFLNRHTWKEVPLKTPIGTLGLNPKILSKSKTIISTTGHTDLVQSLLGGSSSSLTHIVYFPPSEIGNNNENSQQLLYRTWIAFEHILSSIANTNTNANASNNNNRRQPHLVYISYHPSLDILAKVYAQKYGVMSVAIRLSPQTILYGPWERRRQHQHDHHGGVPPPPPSPSSSVISTMLRNAVLNATNTTMQSSSSKSSSNSSSLSSATINLLYAKDAAEGLLAAMQVRPSPMSSAVVFELQGSTRLSSYQQLQSNVQSLLVGQKLNKNEQLGSSIKALSREEAALSSSSSAAAAAAAVRLTKQYLQWYPSTSVEEGLVRTLAWHMDQVNPFGSSTTTTSTSSTLSQPYHATAVTTGDALLQLHSLSPCTADDIMCHSSPPHQHNMPCLSECSTKQQCSPSIFDGGLTELLRDVLEDCGIALYTQAMGNSVRDLTIETEYMEESDGDTPLVCGVAFVSAGSELVQKAMQRVPDADLIKFGITPQHHDQTHHDSAHNDIAKLKRDKLNGRLLYRGWLLLWPIPREDTPDADDRISHADEFLLKLAPGRLFPKEVQKAVYIDPNFAVAPKVGDILFLAQELMYRSPINEHVVASKSVVAAMKKSGNIVLPITGARFRIPAQSQKRAVILLSQLRYQESSESTSFSPDKELSIKQASRFMRFENGEDPLKMKEPTAINKQREFYDRVVSIMKASSSASSVGGGSAEPVYNFEMKHWARTRWIVHDLQLEEARQLRCDWYQEQLHWGNHLDQLSFAFVMAKREYERRVAFNEVDDRARSALAVNMKMKEMLTDIFEWFPLMTESNKAYTPYDEIKVLGHDPTTANDLLEPTSDSDIATAPLFVRIISDHYLGMERKTSRY